MSGDFQATEYGESTVRLGGVRFDFGADAEAASDELACFPGRFAVEMCREPQEQRTAGGLWTVARDEWTDRPDAGIVIAVGKGVPKGGRRDVPPLRPGQAVVVDHEPGQRIEGAVFGGYEAASEVRVYGSLALAEGYAAPWPWWRCILMMENGEGILKVGGRRMKPSCGWLLVARDGVVERTQGGIYVPDEARHGCCKGTVVDVGEGCYGLLRGDRVLYLSQLTKRVRQLFADSEDSKRLCLVHVDALQAHLVGEAAPDDYVARMVAASAADALA